MTSPEVSVERLFRAPRHLVWALLADTDRCDRALGLSIPRYVWREIDGRRTRVGEAKQGGLAISWTERPYDWLEGRFLVGRRDFLTGPAKEGGIRVEVEDAPGGCLARVIAFGAARSWALKLLSPILRSALRRRLQTYIDGVAKMVEDPETLRRLSEGSASRPSVARVQELLLMTDSDSVGAASAATNQAELQRRQRQLESSPTDADVAQRIATFLGTRSDEEVAQIRPFELAGAWGLGRRDVLRGFLYATKAGLVDLNWQINCPVCRVSASVVTSLAEVGREVHCESCNIQYSVAFGENVEAVFRCSAALRSVEPAVYCASSPTFRPHVLAQLRLPAGGSRTETLAPWCGHVRVRTLDGQTSQSHESDSAPQRLEIVVTNTSVVLSAHGRAENGETEISMRSECDEAVHVLLERAGWAADAALGSVVASMAEFVDLFATEAPAAGLELSIGRLTLLFSDLTGSTALYSRIGDARAFAVVQEHFSIVEALVNRHGGALVKTMGDAVMATFASLPDAVAAALDAVKETEARHSDLDIGVKLGVHEGPCLAVRANERLDFFGTTVNVAARLQAQARAGELVLHQAVANRPELAKLLEGRTRREFETGLKGIEGAQHLVGFDLA
ncbi:MAG: SRPBCC family protein [Nannocystaceae bacterium]|nr:SRPBCC family protein [Nannocystaceae bacterium]